MNRQKKRSGVPTGRRKHSQPARAPRPEKVRRSPGSRLRARESGDRTPFAQGDDAVIIFEPQTEIILDANRKALDLYGFTRKEFVGSSLKKLTMDVTRGEDLVRLTLAAGHGAEFQTVHFRKDGSSMTLSVRGSVVDYHGTPAILSVVRNMSHILSVEDVLRGQDNVLQRLLTSSDDVVCMQDRDGKYLFYKGSPKFSQNAGEVRQKTPYDFYPPVVARKMMERLYQVFSTGKSVSAESQMEWEGENIWYLDQMSPVRNAAGEVVSVVTISRNITERKRSEEKLRRSEERYRAFIEFSSDGIWRLEMTGPIATSLPPEQQVPQIFHLGVVAECNDVMVQMLGHRIADSLVGLPASTLMGRDDPQAIEGLRQFVQSGYRLSDMETREIDAAGNVRYFSNSYTGIVEQGNLVRIWGTRRDITEQRRVDREMRLLAHTITSTKDCVSITDLDDRILFVNDAFLETYGYSEPELIGKSLAMLYSSSTPADLARQIVAATLNGGWYGEVVHRMKNGGELPVELWTSVVRNDEGDPVALVGVARDITDRKRMEQALRQSEARLRRITDAMRDVVTQTDQNGVIQYISPSGYHTLGYRPEETLGTSLFSRIHPDDREAVEAAFASLLNAKTGTVMEFRYHHARGEYVWLEAVVNLLLDDRKSVVGVVFAIRDIAGRKLAEEQVRGSLEEKEVMLKEIHHRVKNNLQVISSLLSLQSEFFPDDNVRKVLRDSQNRVRSMAIIHQRLYQSSNLAEINFAGYIEELLSQLSRSYGAAGKNLSLTSTAEEIFLGVDKAIPCGIIINELVSNALKYAFPEGSGGTITVEFSQHDQEIRLAVVDDGVGMPGSLDFQSTESLGLRLVNLLVEQVAGQLTRAGNETGPASNPGTRWEVRFHR
jgi:PAS domain S-box-containing protein